MHHISLNATTTPRYLLQGDHLWRRILFTLLPAQRDQGGQAQVTNLDLA